METLQLAGVVVIVAALIWSIVGIVVLVRTGKTPDQAVAIKLNEVSENPTVIHEIRLAYQGATDAAKDFHAMTLAVLNLIAPLTPGKADDAARDLLDKIDDPVTPNAQPPAQS